MAPLDQVRHALLSQRISCPDTLESSIAEYLVETVSSKDFSLDEKITSICDTVPALYKLRRPEIVEILRIMALDKSPPVKQPQAEKKSSHPKPQSPSKEEKSDSIASESTAETANKIRSSLNHHCVDGSDLVEDELVEYLLTFVNELEIEGSFSSLDERSTIGDFLMSFFEDVGKSPDCLNEIIDILYKAVIKRRPKKSSITPLRVTEKTATTQNLKPMTSIESVSSRGATEEHKSAQALDDISCLTSMMPNTSEETINYVYTVLCACNRIEAAQHLADRCDDESIRKLEESRYAYDRKEKETSNLSSAQQKKMKDRLCDKYGEKEVPDKYDSKGKIIKSRAKLPVQFVDIDSKDKKVMNFIF